MRDPKEPVSCPELTTSFDNIPQFLFPHANQRLSKKKKKKNSNIEVNSTCWLLAAPIAYLY